MPASGQPSQPALTSGGFKVGDRARIWLDHAHLGSGERHLIVAGITPTTIALYSAAALVEVTIPRAEFERHAARYESDPRAVLDILQCNLATAERNRLEHNTPPRWLVEWLRVEVEEAQSTVLPVKMAA